MTILMVMAAVGSILSQDAGRTAVAVGLTPTALAAGGADASNAGAMLAELAEEPLLISQFEAAVTDCAAKRSAAVAARDAVRRSPHDQEARGDLASAIQALDQAEAAVVSLSTQLKAVCLEGADPRLVDLAARCRSNGPRRASPEFKVLAMSDTEWRELCQALIALRRAERLGESPPAEAERLVLTRRAEAAVVAASQGLGENLEAVRQRFRLVW